MGFKIVKSDQGLRATFSSNGSLGATLEARLNMRACAQKVGLRYAEGLLLHSPHLAKGPPLGLAGEEIQVLVLRFLLGSGTKTQA